MCQTLVPQSTCRQCGVPVTFEGLPDPCNLVREEGVPFGACGNHSVRTILGPSLCNNCRYQLDDDVVAMGNTGGLLATESAPIPFLPPLPVIRPSSYNAGPAFLSPRPRPAYDLPPPPGLNPPRGRRRSFTPGQIYQDSPRPMSGVRNYGATARPMSGVSNYGTAVRPPTPYRPLGRHGSRRGQPGESLRERYGIADPEAQVRTPGAVSRGGLTFVGGGHPIAPRTRTRQPTPYVTRVQDADEDMLEYDENEDYEEYEDEEEEEEEEEASDSSGGAALPGRPSVGSPWSTTQPSSSRPMPLPGVSPIFSGFGHTAPRAPPPNTPAYGDLLPELPSPTDGPEAWIPPSWPAPGPLPVEAAEALERHTANSYFRGHRVYFVTSAGDEIDTVLVTTPDRRRMRILSAELYRATAHEVNERETALREALERAQREQQAEANRAAREERRRQRKGACIHFPCRDAGCDKAHEEGQRRPLTPSDLAALFQANLRVRDDERPAARGRVPIRSATRLGGSGLRRVEFVEGDDVFGDGEVGELVEEEEEEEEGEEGEEGEENKENATPQDANPTTPRRLNLQPTVEDDTPSPLDLNGTTNQSTNPSPAPQHLAEQDDEQETHPTIHLTSDAGSRIPGPARAPRQRDGQVRNRPFRDQTRTSTGSPPPRWARTYIPVRTGSVAQASWRARSEAVAGAGGSSGAAGPSSQRAAARQKGKGKDKETAGGNDSSSSSAQKLLSDDGPGLGDLVIPPKEEDDVM